MAQFLIEIIARARTYQTPNWRFLDPQTFSPYLLASLGYSVTAPLTLTCAVCHHQVHIPPDLETAPALLPPLLDNHREDCLFRNEKPHPITSEELYLRMDDLIGELNRETKKHQLHTYPLLNTSSIRAFTKNQSFTLRKILPSYGLDLDNYNIPAMLNFFGWLIRKDQREHNCLQCYFCGRVVSYQSCSLTERDKQTRELQEGVQEQNLFDPVNEHRYFCLWVGEANGWLVYLQHLYDKLLQISGYKSRTSPLQTRKMRVQMDKFIDVFRQKAEGGFLKMKGLLRECGQIGMKIKHDNNIVLEGVDFDQDFKRMREEQHEIELFVDGMRAQFKNSFKKIKLS